MARRKQPVIPDALLDQLLAGTDAKTAFDKDGLLDELKKALAERALNAEMDHHLDAGEGDGNRRKAGEVVSKRRAQKLGKADDLVNGAVEETLSYYGFPEQHWRRIRTNNPLERIIREIRRRTRVVGAFPDGESALNLAAARLRHIAGTQWSTRRYLNMQPLHEHKLTAATA